MKKARSKIFCFLRAHPLLIKLISFLPLLIVIIAISLVSLRVKSYLNNKGFFLKDIGQITQDPQEIIDSTSGRTNFLILGIRGEGYDSPDLSDTIIVFSYNHQDKNIKMISIPRDLWIDSYKTKINSIYHYGQEKNQDKGGISMIQASIQQVLDVPIHYTIVINFSAFRQVIDSLGGVTIDVQNEFIDQKFPIPGKENAYPIETRFETVKFDKGLQLMDGETALKFVRSRNSEGDEGTDFARSKRQQLLLSALKNKIFETNVFLNKQKIDELLTILETNIQTNIPPDIYPTLIKLALKNKDSQIGSINLSSENESGQLNILETKRLSDYDNQWVLIARDGNWQALKDYINNKLQGSQ
jgi:polyisoprenyl-teichoic acid--peptidoglycan teichoic acid transferase